MTGATGLTAAGVPIGGFSGIGGGSGAAFGGSAVVSGRAVGPAASRASAECRPEPQAARPASLPAASAESGSGKFGPEAATARPEAPADRRRPARHPGHAAPRPVAHRASPERNRERCGRHRHDGGGTGMWVRPGWRSRRRESAVVVRRHHPAAMAARVRRPHLRDRRRRRASADRSSLSHRLGLLSALASCGSERSRTSRPMTPPPTAASATARHHRLRPMIIGRLPIADCDSNH